MLKNFRDIQQGTDTVSKAKRLIKSAEAELGHLSNGECRDLLKDNLIIGSDEARLVVRFLRGEDKC